MSQINVPIQLPDNFADQVAAVVIQQIEKRLDFLLKTTELGPYPNKTEIKKVLGIGDDKLSGWIANGLKIQPWSEKDIRVERGELQRFLKENFEI